ncbi:hypothetical protein M942_06025 [Enterobacter ludwigii]|nr:hypothetical protein M942_06025 [Enterobacter ludwigii]
MDELRYRKGCRGFVGAESRGKIRAFCAIHEFAQFLPLKMRSAQRWICGLSVSRELAQTAPAIFPVQDSRRIFIGDVLHAHPPGFCGQHKGKGLVGDPLAAQL